MYLTIIGLFKAFLLPFFFFFDICWLNESCAVAETVKQLRHGAAPQNIKKIELLLFYALYTQ